MKEDKFIKENMNTWKYLEETAAKLKFSGFKKLRKDELNNFISAYNITCGHLSYSRTYFGNTKTTEYLNKLVSMAHGYIYATNTSNFKKMVKFFFVDFPLLIKNNLGYFIASTSLFLAGMVIAFAYIMISSDNAPAFVPQGLIDGINNFAGSGREWDNAITSSTILTNNIKVGIIAFVFGITLGIGTCYVLVFNGFMLGGAAALAYQKHISVEFWSMILPHGVLELFAIFICGAAGLMIAKSIINPGIYSRKDTIIRYGKKAIYSLCCTIPIFTVAGIIEGYITPSALPEVIKLIFAMFTLILLMIYIAIPVFIFRKKESEVIQEV